MTNELKPPPLPFWLLSLDLFHSLLSSLLFDVYLYTCMYILVHWLPKVKVDDNNEKTGCVGERQRQVRGNGEKMDELPRDGKKGSQKETYFCAKKCL